MKTSTIVWTLAVLIIVISAGAYFYTETPATAPTAAQNELPNPSGSNLPPGDLAPVPATPIASSTSTQSMTSSSSVRH